MPEPKNPKPRTTRQKTTATQPPQEKFCHIHNSIKFWENLKEIRAEVCVQESEYPLTEFEGKSYCLFHLPTNKKDTAKFEEIFQARLEKIVKSESDIESDSKISQKKQNEFKIKRNFKYDFSYVWFPSIIKFNDITFNQEVSFRAAIFSSNADFSSVKFSKYTDFRATTFKAKVDFSSAIFNAKVDFSSAIFNAKVDFSSAILKNSVDFTSAIFQASVTFNSVTFNGLTFFNSVIFHSSASFNSSIFEENTNFRSINFKSSASFKSVIFKNSTSFESSTFNSSVIFSFTAFGGETSFYSTIFKGDANFKSAIFSAETNFSSAIFYAFAKFNSATFNAVVNFRSSSFISDTYFNSAKFLKDAFFERTQFGKETVLSFTKASFEKQIFFVRTRFKNEVCFGSVIFGKESDIFFRGAFFANKVDFQYCASEGYLRFSNLRQGKDCKFDFQEAAFEKASRVSFHTLKLEPNWFVNVDSRKFVFTDIDWGKTIKWKKHNENIYDELKRLEERGIKDQKKRLLEIACRQLAVNAEENNRYGEASQFRYMAMETKRLENAGIWRFLNLHWVYKWSSCYGESWRRALVVLLGLLLLFSLVYISPVVTFDHGEKKKEFANDAVERQIFDVADTSERFKSLSLGESAYYSLAVSALQKPEPKPADSLTKIFVILQTILAPLQAALLALAIRRKFMR